MVTTAFFIFALFSCIRAQYMSSYGSSTGYQSQMGMPMGYGHMPMHHMGMFREVGPEVGPYNGKMEDMVPIKIMRAKIPGRIGVHDYSMMNVNAPDGDELPSVYKQSLSLSDIKRPVLGVISLLSPPVHMPVPQMDSQPSSASTKAIQNYQDTTAAVDDLMTCMGMDVNEPMKVHQPEPRIIFTRGMPYYIQTMQTMHNGKQ